MRKCAFSLWWKFAILFYFLEKFFSICFAFFFLCHICGIYGLNLRGIKVIGLMSKVRSKLLLKIDKKISLDFKDIVKVSLSGMIYAFFYHCYYIVCKLWRVTLSTYWTMETLFSVCKGLCVRIEVKFLLEFVVVLGKQWS